MAVPNDAYRQKTLSRLLVLNFKHKSVENSIKETKTHTQPDSNGHVPSTWPNNISKSLAMIMVHEQQAKQKSESGGNPRKRSNPRRNGR